MDIFPLTGLRSLIEFYSMDNSIVIDKNTNSLVSTPVFSDPEEFLNSLLQQIMRADPFLKLR